MAGSIRVRDVRIGEGAPKTIVPLMGTDACSLRQGARRAVSAGAEVIEWRVDHLLARHAAADVADVARTLRVEVPHTPLLATVRTHGEGGEVSPSPAAYTDLVRRLIGCGCCDLVDVELAAGTHAVESLCEDARRAEVVAVVSKHDFERTPATDRLCETLETELELGAGIAKLAVMARSARDACRLMEATARVAAHARVPLVTMAMGTHGVITRLAGQAFGSAATFCALEGASAPGQVGLEEARTCLGALEGALVPRGRIV